MSKSGSWTEYEIRDKDRPNESGTPAESREKAEYWSELRARQGKSPAFVHERHVTHTESVVYVVVARRPDESEETATRHNVTEWGRAKSLAAECRYHGMTVRIDKATTVTEITIEEVRDES